jgi:hypothetical protein
VRFNYYQRMVRSIMAMLEDAQNIMKVDNMDDAIRSIGRVLIELEDTWTILALRRAEVLSEHADHRLPERAGHDRSGAS